MTPQELRALTSISKIEKIEAVKQAAKERENSAAQKRMERQLELENKVTQLVETQLNDDRLILAAKKGENYCHIFSALHKNKYAIRDWSIKLDYSEYPIVRKRFKELIEPRGFKVKEIPFQECPEDRHWDDYMTTYATEGIGFNVEW